MEMSDMDKILDRGTEAETVSEKKNDLLLVIPAYNEAQNIERVVDELIRDYPCYDYVIVTDGPTDGTDRICDRRGYNVIHLPVNLGLTGSFQTGMKYASMKGYSYAVQFDGDGQHRPEFIKAMYEKAIEGDFDIVMGSRFIGIKNEMGGLRNLGSKLIRAAVKLTTGKSMSDPTCGLRLYNKRMIDFFAWRLNFAPEPDTISFLIKNGAKTAEVPIHVSEREGGASLYINPINAIRYMLRMLTSILLIQVFRDHD